MYMIYEPLIKYIIYIAYSMSQLRSPLISRCPSKQLYKKFRKTAGFHGQRDVLGGCRGGALPTKIVAMLVDLCIVDFRILSFKRDLWGNMTWPMKRKPR